MELSEERFKISVKIELFLIVKLLRKGNSGREIVLMLFPISISSFNPEPNFEKMLSKSKEFVSSKLCNFPNVLLSNKLKGVESIINLVRFGR